MTKKNTQFVPENMNIKSNLDLIERLNAAEKYLLKACHIAGKTYGEDGPRAKSMTPLDAHYQDYLPIKSQKALKELNFDLARTLIAIDNELPQLRKIQSVHYLQFPHQNKKMVKWFGNHHVTEVTHVEKKGNKLILTLGYKRQAMTEFLDILNYVRKTPTEPSANEPKVRKNLRKLK